MCINSIPGFGSIARWRSVEGYLGLVSLDRTDLAARASELFAEGTIRRSVSPPPRDGRRGWRSPSAPGRVVIMGEAAMFSAQVINIPGREPGRMGMNVSGHDDRQLALNVLHWLAAVLRKRQGSRKTRRNRELFSSFLRVFA